MMVVLDKTYYLQCLYKLNMSELSLKSLSAYVTMFDEPETVVEGIIHVHKNSSLEHRMVLYYLVYDILKNTECKRTKELLTGFIEKHFKIDYNSSKTTPIYPPYDKIHKAFLEKYFLPN